MLPDTGRFAKLGYAGGGPTGLLDPTLHPIGFELVLPETDEGLFTFHPYEGLLRDGDGIDEPAEGLFTFQPYDGLL